MARHASPVLTLPGMEGARMDPLSEAQLRSEEARRIFEARQDVGPWMDEYFDLMAAGWPWRKAVYILWASQPKGKRFPATQWELATEILGLTSDRTIREWKSKDPALMGRIKDLQASPLIQARAEIFEALAASASTGSYRNHQDRKLALEMLGDYSPKQSLVVSAVDVEEIEAQDTERLAAMAAMPIGGFAGEEGGEDGQPA